MIWLVDGRSGAGKTSFAERLAASHGARVVHMDDLYAGWRGLATGSRLLERGILEPLARGERAHWLRWDWEEGAYVHPDTLEPGTPLVVEGCGALTLASAEHADRTFWLEAAEPVRRARALARDGDDSWWELWRAQEDAHIAANAPATLADEIVET